VDQPVFSGVLPCWQMNPYLTSALSTVYTLTSNYKVLLVRYNVSILIMKSNTYHSIVFVVVLYCSTAQFEVFRGVFVSHYMA